MAVLAASLCARGAGAAERVGPSPFPEGARPARTLRVTGEGKARTAPDVAVVTLGISIFDASLARATREANERARRMLDVFHPAVASADIHTVRYSVQVQYARLDKPDDLPRIAGYRVENVVQVKVRDLARVGALLDAAVAAGANEVQGLEFLKDDLGPEESRARTEAVKAARAKAEEMAKAAGVELGELMDLSEGVRGPAPRPLMARAMALAPTSAPPVEAGELEITAQVEAVYAIR